MSALQFERVDYPAQWVAHLDTTPWSFARISFGTATFKPRLCIAPPMSSSPLSRHVTEPLVLVSFSFPTRYLPLIIGQQGQHHRLLADVAGLDRTSVRMGEQELLPGGFGPRQVWAALKSVGSMQQVDALIEAFFLLMRRLQRFGRAAQVRVKRIGQRSCRR